MKKFILVALLVLPMSMFAQKFAHVNTEEVIKAMPEYSKAMEEMQKMQKDIQDELARMQSEIQTKADELQKNPPTVETIKQRKEQEVQDLYQRYQQFLQTSDQELQKAQQEKTQPIFTKVQNAIKELGTAGGYIYIMDVTSGIPFINETLSTNITSQLKTKLGIK